MGRKPKISSRREGAALSRIAWDDVNTKHDDSGQVYTEVSCQGSPMISDWKWRTVGSTLQYKNFRFPGPGCATLYDMATRCCLSNSMDITSEILEEIPETVGLALWNRIITARLDSLQSFIEFAQRYPSTIRRKFHVISKPNLSLPFYYKDVISPSYQWLTFLTLLNVTVPRTTLIQVSLVTNLVALAVGPNVLAPDIGVDDSLIRTWSRSASMGAFPALRVLVLRGQSQVTPRVFEYLAFFPALAIFGTNSVRGSGLSDESVALSFGWKHRSNKDTDEWRKRGTRSDCSGWDELLHALFKLGMTVDVDSHPTESNQNLDKLPVIHLAIGGYGDDVDASRLGGGPMHIWNRKSNSNGLRFKTTDRSKLPDWSSSNQNSKSQSFSGPSETDFMRKRKHDAPENHRATKVTKPAFRTSKASNIGDLLSEFTP